MDYKCLSEKRKIYFKKESSKAIGNVAKIIFDFDGVLVYTAESYRQNIISVVDYYFLEILGLEGERRKFATLEDIQKFKDTGLYNNDWDLSYSIIAYYLAITIRQLQQKQVFQKFTKQFKTIQFSELPSFLQTLRDIGKSLRGYGINANELANMKNDKALGLESFLAQTIVKNQSSFETIIWYFLPQITKDEKILVKNLIPYDSEKPDLLKRLFEESYLGEKLFSEFYGLPAIFNFDRSFLEKEEFIPTKETLDALRIRSDKFAIYSEKPRFQGMALLNKSKFKDYFNEKQCFFQEDLTESGGSRLGKPNPTFFTELIENIFVKNHKVAYVGDGVADILLVRNARAKGYLNLLFFGVLCSSQHPSNLFSQYIKFEADAIMTDVNDLPYLFGKMDVIMK